MLGKLLKASISQLGFRKTLLAILIAFSPLICMIVTQICIDALFDSGYYKAHHWTKALGVASASFILLPWSIYGLKVGRDTDRALFRVTQIWGTCFLCLGIYRAQK